MFNLRLAKDYLWHRLKAKTRHGLHSPFVYRLVDKIIYDFNAKPVYNDIELICKDVLNDSRMITVTRPRSGDLKKKLPGDVAKHALNSPRLAQLLYRLTHDLKPHTIVELGTCLGGITLYLQKAAPDARLYALESHSQLAAEARKVFTKAHLGNIELITGNFDDTLPKVIDNLEKIDMVFVNGNRQKEAALKYFEWCLPKVHAGTLLVFNDIYKSRGMKEAWGMIKAHPSVIVTIDLFWMGLVYFRKGQAKEDFLIRF